MLKIQTNFPREENTEEQITFGDLQDVFKLLELPPDLEKYLKENPFSDLYLKGNKKVVLCTSEKTYNVVKVKYSNMMLVKKRLSGVVDGILDHYFELNEISDGIILMELYDILKHKLYKSKMKDEEVGFDQRKIRKVVNVTMDYLEKEVYGCRAQIEKCLKRLKSFQTQGSYWLLDPGEKIEIMKLILLTIQENDMPLDNISEKVIRDDLVETFSEAAVKSCIQELSLPSEDAKLKFCPIKLAVSVAIKILGSGEWPLLKFMEEWKREIGEYIAVKEDFLCGFAIITGDLNKSVRRLDGFELPRDISERFKEMFSLKKIWSLVEITPYIENYVGSNEKVEKFLNKFCRTTRGFGIKKFYVQK